jgi:hypothetical protein
MKGCLIQSCTHRWKHLVYPLVRLTNHQLIAKTMFSGNSSYGNERTGNGLPCMAVFHDFGVNT